MRRRWRERTVRGVWTSERADDADLVAHCAVDPEAFGALFDRHLAAVYRHCVRQLGTDLDADDLAAVTFLEAWRHRERIRLVAGSALPWLLLTATNVTRNHRRSRRRYRAALNRLAAPAPTPDHADDVAARLTFRELAAPLAAAVAELAPLDRQVVSLCLLGGVSYADAAELLGLTHASIRSRLMRARRDLREQLEGAGIHSSEGNLDG